MAATRRIEFISHGRIALVDALDWLKAQVPEFNWNLKGDPQGLTATAVLELSLEKDGPFDSLDAVRTALSEHREWVHITDEEGHQLNSAAEILTAEDCWVSQRQTPWAS